MESVLATFKVNVTNAKKLLLAAIPRIASEEWSEITEERQVNHKVKDTSSQFCVKGKLCFEGITSGC